VAINRDGNQAPVDGTKRGLVVISVRAGVATPEGRKWWIVFRPHVGAVLTFENNNLAQRIALWQPLPRLWRGAGVGGSEGSDRQPPFGGREERQAPDHKPLSLNFNPEP